MAQVEQTAEANQTAVHTAATAVATAANKLAQALRESGAEPAEVKEVDDWANGANEIASAAVGNVAEEPAAPPEPEYSPTPGEPPGGLGSAIQDFASDPQL